MSLAQESHGLQTISVSSNNIIKRYIYNDSNLRAGGKASVDKRLAKLYNKKYFSTLKKI